jgi:eukaryotic-like serine/threonine-protein kinase
VSSPRDRRVEELFAVAVEMPGDQRAAYVEAHAGDADISREVLTLLVAHESRGRLDSIGDWLHSGESTAGHTQLEELLPRLHGALGHRYRIDHEVGRGGMAIVLLAEDIKHERKVALKVLQPSLALSIGPARFLQEISIAAKLSHPHILPLHDSGEAGGLLYYVMPYVAGESLLDRLRREPRLPLPDALQIMREVADALGYAHRQGVIHRDIKPGNIMFQAGHALVADFGIARAMSKAGGNELRETGLVLGTPAYMSPEQAGGDGDVDERSDVYSMACVLYEMLAGRPLFKGSSMHQILRQHAATATDSLSGLPPGVPATVVAAIRRALSMAPSDRQASAAEFAEAIAIPDTNATPRLRRVALIGVTVIALAVAIATMMARSKQPVLGAASVIAILPIASAVSDTALDRLGRDLVVTLSANLDGVGEIRTLDALTVLAQTSESGALSVEQGAALARRLGASSVVSGTIVRVRPNVRVDLGLFTADSLRQLARASVTTDPNDLTTLTDSLTWALLRGVWRARAPPTPNVAAVTTRSVPALRAFLEGERAGLEGRWDDAADAFERAMRADSTFWLAQWRYSYARWWYLQAVDDSVLGPLYEHRFALPERDRLVLESWWTDTISIALSRGREAVERFPDYWPGWMQFADWLFHVGPVAGYERTEARAALENTVALNPSFLPAWENLYWVTISRDTVAARRALDALTRLGYGRASTAEYGFDITRVYRLELDFARRHLIDEALLDSIADDLVGPAHHRLGGGPTLPAVQVALSRRVIQSGASSQLAAIHETLLAEAWAARGAWDKALVMAERQTQRIGTDPLEAYRYATIGSWLGAVAPDTAARLRVAAARDVSRVGSSAMSSAELAWLDGIFAVTTEDRAGLASARLRVRAADTESSALLDRSLEAFDTGLAGDWVSAAHTLASLNWERPDLLVPGYDSHPYVIAVCRLAAARLYRQQGNPEAARLLMWFDAWWALDGYRPARRVLAGLAMLERGRLAASDGDPTLARQWFGEFVARYDTPVAPHERLLTEARRATR